MFRMQGLLIIISSLMRKLQIVPKLIIFSKGLGSGFYNMSIFLGILIFISILGLTFFLSDPASIIMVEGWIRAFISWVKSMFTTSTLKVSDTLVSEAKAVAETVPASDIKVVAMPAAPHPAPIPEGIHYGWYVVGGLVVGVAVWYYWPEILCLLATVAGGGLSNSGSGSDSDSDSGSGTDSD